VARAEGELVRAERVYPKAEVNQGALSKKLSGNL